MSENASQKIFLVDDEAPMLRVIGKFLTKQHYDVNTFISAPEALSAAEDNPPDLLITDILMPEMNGVELIEAIHTIIPDLPIICLSGHATPSTLEQLEKQSIKAFLQKPVKLKELEEHVIKALVKTKPKPTKKVKEDDKPSILVVDDNEPLLDSLRLFLLHEGYKVTTCADGKEALECYAIYNPDIIITDLIMPHIDGVKLIQKIKTLNPEQAVIPMSGESRKATILDCERISGSTVLRKPLDFNVLADRIKSFDSNGLYKSKVARKERILRKATAKMSPASQDKFNRQWKKQQHKHRHSAKLPTWKVAILIMCVSLLAGFVISYLTKPTIEPIKTRKKSDDILKMGSDMLKYLHRDENRELKHMNR